MNTTQLKSADRPDKAKKQSSGTKVAPPKGKEDQKALTTTPATGDQKAGDQNDAPAPKKAKKQSKTVIAWKALKKPVPDDTVITVKPEHLAKCPKSQTAADRFRLYKTGMTAAEYVTVFKNAGHTAALAHADIRWDIAAGFITVDYRWDGKSESWVK